MRHFNIIIAFCLSFAGAANAQQPFHWQSTNGPGTTAPSILEVNSNGDILAGAGNILMRSTDGGVSWSRLPIPHYLGNVNSCATLPGGKIIVLCGQPAIVRMNADGSALTSLPIKNAGWIVSDRKGDLFCKLNSSMISMSKDAGDTWTTINGPSGESIFYFSADEERYYVTTATGIYSSTDQGNTWRRSLNGLVTGNFCYILAGHGGYVWANAENNDLYISSDYGQDWTQANFLIDYEHGMVSNSNNDVMIMLYGTIPAILHNSSANNSGIANASGASAVDSSGRWLAGANGIPNIYETSSDTSSAWHNLIVPLSSPSTLNRAYSSVVANASVFINTWPPYTADSNYILNTLKQWVRLSENNPTTYVMDYFDNSILHTISGDDLIRSTDSGKTWSSNILGALPTGTVHVAAAAPHRIYAATKGVYYTDDIGKDWSETNDNFLTGSVTSLCADSTGSLFVACSDGLFTSSDQGNSWRPLILPPNGGISNMRANAASTIAFYSNDTLFRSENSGLHWEWASLPDHSAITDFYISPASDIFASSGSGVYYWPSGSTNFYNASDGLDSIGVNALAADSAGNIYAATNGMGVWVGVGDLSQLLLGVAENPSTQSDAVVSPNPASSIVRINLPSEGLWSAVAMDALGRELQMKYSLAGETFQCDVSNFIPGAYEIIIRSGSDQIVSRVQVIR